MSFDYKNIFESIAFGEHNEDESFPKIASYFNLGIKLKEKTKNSRIDWIYQDSEGRVLNLEMKTRDRTPKGDPIYINTYSTTDISKNKYDTLLQRFKNGERSILIVKFAINSELYFYEFNDNTENEVVFNERYITKRNYLNKMASFPIDKLIRF